MKRDKNRTRFIAVEEEQKKQMSLLIEMLNDAILVCDDNLGVPNTKQVAEYLIERGVVVNEKKRTGFGRRRK